MKKVLFISYHFPPAGNTGAVRSAKFVKYLPLFGWEPVVVSCKKPFNWGVPDDAIALKEIPSQVKVLRTATFEPFNRWWKLKKTRRATSAAHRKEPAMLPAAQKQDGKATTKHFFLDLFNTPDRVQGWIPFAFFRGLRVMATESIDAIIATSPPAGALVAGYLLSKQSGKPLVVDYRDPWNANNFTRYHFGFFRSINRALEKMVLERARYIISVSEARKAELIASFPEIDKNKHVVITNGFDSADIAVKNNGRFDTLTFIHAGTLYSSDGVDDFLASFFEIMHKHPELRQEMHALFLGSKPASTVFDKLERMGAASHHHRIARNECLALMAKAHVPLIFLKNDTVYAGCIASKLFECMMLKKPVLAVVPEGETKSLIEKLKMGAIVNYGEHEQLKAALLDYYRQYKANRIDAVIDEQSIARFERKALTQQLVALLEKL